MSESAPVAGASFSLNATVRNQGAARSASTTLRYYQSTDSTITTGDTELGTDSVFRLDASVSGDEWISLTAPSTPGTYYYGACVDWVSDELDTQNNCSVAVSGNSRRSARSRPGSGQAYGQRERSSRWSPLHSQCHGALPCHEGRSVAQTGGGPGSSRWSGTPGTVRRRWWSGLCGTDCWMTSDTDCFGDLQRHCGEGAPHQAGRRH